MKFALLIFILGLIVSVSTVNAQNQIIKYKRYLIPINSAPTGPCEDRKIPDSVTIDQVNAADDGQARVFVTTDIGGGDPDDKQSLAHILTYADELKLVGFASSTPIDSDSDERVSNIGRQSIIKQYLTRYQQELFGLPGYPDLTSVRDNNVFLGSENRFAPNQTNSADTDASRAIVALARCTFHEDGGRPLYVLTWGSSTDVFRALSSEETKDVRKVVRIVSYSTPNFNNLPAQQNWVDASQQSDIWLVDYRDAPRPLQNCDQSQMDALSRKPLSAFPLSGILFEKNLGGIVYNGGPSGAAGRPFNAEGGEVSCGGQRFTKLGDTITTMFVLNPPAQRQNPHNGTVWGDYNRVAGSSNRWFLALTSDRKFKGFDDVYTNWINK